MIDDTYLHDLINTSMNQTTKKYIIHCQQRVILQMQILLYLQ